MRLEILKGTVASGQEVIKGKAKVVVDPSEKLNNEEIMVVEITSPLHFNQMINAKGIIADLGGLLCHTAILARELGKPCIVGTEKATKIIKNGDVIEMDCGKGIIYKNGD